mmetsp:Transcript_22433/g.44972  ORF Transcript_22433/g.44972 Transcript_22433/m.44972 type:complete len:242 (+) Transcript_22433:176-901(+)
MTRSLSLLLLASAARGAAAFSAHPSRRAAVPTALGSDRLFSAEEMTKIGEAREGEGDPYAEMTAEDLASELQSRMADAIRPGDALPDVSLLEGASGYGAPAEINLRELCAGKYVGVVFEPRAFSADCMEMVGYYVDLWEALQDPSQNKVEPLDEFVFVCPDDAYVMHALGLLSGGGPEGLRFLSDSKGEFMAACGVALDKEDTMARPAPYQLTVKDGKIRFIDADVKRLMRMQDPEMEYRG